MTKAKIFNITKKPRQSVGNSVIQTSNRPKFIVKQDNKLMKPKIFPCATCGKEYLSISRLIIHKRTHTGEKPFKCNMCPKSFNENGNLKTHMRTHTGERPFKCTFEGCNKSYKVYSHLSDHIRSHLKIKPFKCEMCDTSYGRKTLLKAHLLIHTGEKPYTCPFPNCEKRFRERGNMRTHYKKHFNGKIKLKTSTISRHMSYDFLTNYDTHAQFLHPNSTYDEKESWHNTENEAKKFDPFEINLTDNVQDNYYIYENDSDKELNCFQCLNVENLMNHYKDEDFSHCTFNIGNNLSLHP